MDARDGVASETADRWCSRVWSAPRGWGDGQIEEYVADLRATIRRHLPSSDRNECLELVRRWQSRLRESNATHSWPSIGEVAKAARSLRQDRRDTGTDWPHRNSEFVIESVARWVSRFGQWPEFSEFPKQTAAEIVKRGLLTRSEIVEAGGPR